MIIHIDQPCSKKSGKQQQPFICFPEIDGYIFEDTFQTGRKSKTILPEYWKNTSAILPVENR